MKTKRKGFDIVMSIRRHEERRLVVAEMKKHWQSLSTQADKLKEMSSLLSSEALGSMYLSYRLSIMHYSDL